MPASEKEASTVPWAPLQLAASQTNLTQQRLVHSHLSAHPCCANSYWQLCQGGFSSCGFPPQERGASSPTQVAWKHIH